MKKIDYIWNRRIRKIRWLVTPQRNSTNTLRAKELCRGRLVEKE